MVLGRRWMSLGFVVFGCGEFGFSGCFSEVRFSVFPRFRVAFAWIGVDII